MFRIGKILAFGVVLSALASMAQAITVDFEDIDGSTRGIRGVGPTYVFDSFTLTNLSSSDPDAFSYAGSNMSRYYTGSVALFNAVAGGITQLTATDGSAFDLTSINLAELNRNRIGVSDVVITGTFADKPPIIWSVGLGGATGMQTFSLSGFTNVLSVTWTRPGEFVQFDNIGVEISAVPLPASSLLMASAFAGGLWASRRRRRAAA